MNITDRLAIKAVLSTFDTLGAKPPKELAAAFTRADVIAAKAPHLGPAPGALEQAVLDAVLESREPAADPAVQAALTGLQLMSNRALDDALAGAASEGIREACTVHLEQILSEWRKSFDQAAKALTSAHERIGDLDLADTTAILAKGGDIAAVWAQAQQAQATIDTVLEGWSSLMRLLRLTPNAEYRALRLAPLTLDQWLNLPHKMTAWDALRAGLSLSLPSLDEYRTRVARILQAQAQPETVVETHRSMVAGREIRVPAGRG